MPPSCSKIHKGSIGGLEARWYIQWYRLRNVPEAMKDDNLKGSMEKIAMACTQFDRKYPKVGTI
jgi:hypothetical protein